MSLTKRVGLVVGAATLSLTGASFAGTNEAGDEDLRNRINDLEAKLAQLQAQNGDQWLTEKRADEIRGLVTDVLSDAGTRSSLLQGGATAGWDNGFFLRSADGNFALNFSGQMQFRYVYNFQDDEIGVDSNRSGFENRRTKVVFDGHVVDPSIEYKIQGAFDRGGGDFELEDAWISKQYDAFNIMVGQFKLPFLREELVSSKRQLAVERSLVNETFTLNRSQGIQVGWESEMFRAFGAFSDGGNASNTPALAFDTEYAFTGRVEFLGSGSWSQFKDFTSWQGEDTAWMVGAAGHFQQVEFGTPAGPEEETLTWTVDGSIEFGGANLYGAFIGRHLDEADADQFGAVIQGGFFLVPDEWEIFARYEWSDPDIDDVEDLNLVTVGVNKYWNKHGLKWTTDVGFGLDEVQSVFASEGAGWRADPADADNQVVIRSQIQLLF